MNKKAPEKSFNLDELCTLVELPKRTVRYYIQIGLVEGPQGETRAAKYFQRHVEQLLQVRKWTDAGLSLDRIAEILTQKIEPEIPPRPRAAGTVEVWSHLVIDDGVELNLEPTRAGLSPKAARKFFTAVQSIYQDIKKKEAGK